MGQHALMVLQGLSALGGRESNLPIREEGQSTQPSDSPRVERAQTQMSELDRFGLKGLLAMLREGETSDQAHLALGMDLNSLGLDLHRPE